MPKDEGTDPISGGEPWISAIHMQPKNTESSLFIRNLRGASPEWAENVFLTREPLSAPASGRSDLKKMRRETEAIMADLGVHISGDRLVKDLTLASQQMVEIAKAVLRNATLLLMDEPTSALSSKEVHVSWI